MKTVPSGMDECETLQAIDAAIPSRRKNRGISQEELSHLRQVDHSRMRRIERGERNVAIFKFVRIGRALGCRASDIFLATQL